MMSYNEYTSAETNEFAEVRLRIVNILRASSSPVSLGACQIWFSGGKLCKRNLGYGDKTAEGSGISPSPAKSF